MQLDKVKIAEFPWVVKDNTGKSVVTWAKVSDKKLVQARIPEGMLNPKIAELVINTTDGDAFTAVKYDLGGDITLTSGDGLMQRLETAFKQPLWLWYYKSDPTPEGVTVHVIMYTRIRCGQCQKLIAPHSCVVKEPGTSDVTPADFIGSFAHECAHCK